MAEQISIKENGHLDLQELPDLPERCVLGERQTGVWLNLVNNTHL